MQKILNKIIFGTYILDRVLYDLLETFIFLLQRLPHNLDCQKYIKMNSNLSVIQG
jgi:hypothetical protein